MKKLFNLLSIVFILAFLVIINIKINNVSAKGNYQDENGNWVFPDYVSTFDDAKYYKNVDLTVSRSSLESTLHTIISTGTTKISYGSSGTRNELKYIDEHPTDTSSVLCIYTGKAISKSGSNDSWNQEHTWAKSHGFPSEGKQAYCDLHHLKACQNSINSTRSNYDFDEVSGSDGTVSKTGKSVTDSATAFEPFDRVKGDIARTMMYMELRYNGGSNTDSVNLTLVNHSTSTSTGNGSFGYLDTLIKWHMEDPVDDFERRRNDRVYAVQGNRNPFVDHPEYANYLYDNCNYGEGLGYTVTYVLPTGASFNYQDTNKYEKGELVTKPNVTPTYLEGYEFSCWYSDSKLTTKWNFNTDTINGNLYLYPKFYYDYANRTPMQNFEQIQTLASLKVSYYETKSGNSTPSCYEKVTSTLTDYSGKYLIVYDKNNVCFDASLSVPDVQENTVKVTITDNKIKATSDLENATLTFTKDGTGYTVQNKAGSYLVNDAKKPIYSTTKATFTIDNNQLKINGYLFQFNANDGQLRFRFYTSGQQVPSLYKLTYGEGYSYEVAKNGDKNQLSLRFAGEINATMYADLYTYDNNLIFGIAIAKKSELNGKTIEEAKSLGSSSVKEIICTYSDLLDDYDYRIVGRMDEIPLEEIQTEFVASCFVVIGSDYYFMKETTYSVKSLANYYLNSLSTDSIVIENEGILTYLSK